MSVYIGSGDNKCWIDGMPFGGARENGNNVGTLRFWIDGMPMAEWTANANNSFFILLGSPG